MAAAVALLAAAPFLPGVLRGESLYFRDLARIVIPVRLLALDGLRAGEVRYWNPYAHEGEPLPAPAVAYVLDALQGLVPGPLGVSLVLVLHYPLAALAFRHLARRRGFAEVASSTGGAAYALGGFALSCVNTYVYALALAWAPLVVQWLHDAAATRDGRRIALAALGVAAMASSSGAEVGLQALAVAALLLPSFRAAPLLSAGAAVLGGALLSAPTASVVAALVPGSAREAGFPAAVVLSHAVHPLTLVQTLVASFHGDLADPTARWWGQNFATLGFPFFVSLYLGATLVAAALAGALTPHPGRWRLLALALGALAVTLGPWAGWTPVVEALAPLRRFRYPSKAFFTVHLAVCLLAVAGLDAAERAREGTRRLMTAAAVLGGVLLALPAAPWVMPQATAWFAAGFFPSGLPDTERGALLSFVLRDAATGGLVALLAALVLGAVAAGRLRAAAGVALVGALLAADLLRAGAGLNPTVPASFFTPTAVGEPWFADLRRGRVFAIDPGASDAYHAARRARRGAQEAWSFATLVELLVPHTNATSGVRTAYSIDLTMLSPEERVLGPQESRPGNVGALLPRLRAAGVTHLLALEPLSDPRLHAVAVHAPPRIRPLAVHVYAVRDPLPLRDVARHVRPARDGATGERASLEPGFLDGGGAAVEGTSFSADRVDGAILEATEGNDHLSFRVRASAPTVLVVRDGWSRGWQATVDGRPAPVLRANGRHRAVPVPAGESRVEMTYVPPGRQAGLLSAALGVAGLGALVALRRAPRAVPC